MASFFLVIATPESGAKPKHGLYRPFPRYLDSLRSKKAGSWGFVKWSRVFVKAGRYP
jgi:hypothetical protein